MRILVASDTHGRCDALRRALEQQPQARHIVFLGDCLRDAQAVSPDFDDRQWHLVRGNNDWWSGQDSAPDADLLCVNGCRLFLTHGHLYRVKWGLEDAMQAARERQAQVLLFGHTHVPLVDYQDGLHLLNPGSLGAGRGTYGVVDLTPAGIAAHIVEVDA